MEKIVFIIPSLSVGGAQLQTVNQVNKLFKLGRDVTLVVFSDQVDLLDIVKIPVAKIKILKVRNSQKVALKNVAGLIQAAYLLPFFSKESTIVACLPAAHFVTRLAYFFRDRRKVWLYHHSMQYDASPVNTLGKKIFWGIGRLLAKRVDFGHIHISKAVCENISHHDLTSNNHILYNAIPRRNVSPAQGRAYLKKYTAWKGERLLVVPGRIQKDKGQLFFLEATKDLLSDKNVFLVFAGHGPDEKKLAEYLDSYSLTKKSHISGVISNDLMLSLMKICDYLIIPSINEGFGLVAIEGLMIGCTMLTSDSGGLKEIVVENENGFTFKNRDGTSLVRRLDHLITEQIKLERSKLFEEYCDKYELKTQVEKLLKIIS